MSEVRVREANQGDAETVLRLMREAAPTQQLELHPSINAKTLEECGWQHRRMFRAFLAEEMKGDDEVMSVVGVAVTHPLYSTWEGFSSSLRHLYVLPSHRRRGIGTKLWREAVKTALSEGCIRCDCFVLETNTDGLRYCLKGDKMVDLTVDEEWLFYRIQGEHMNKYVEGMKSEIDGVLIRQATSEDFPGVRRMIQGLADYEEMPDGPLLDAKTLENHALSRNPPWCECWVVEDTTAAADNKNNEQLVGYLIFFRLLSCEGRAVYMEDLYVSPSHRGRGIGKALWGTAIQIGLKEGATRCEFEVLEMNTQGKEFYKHHGAVNTTVEKGYHLLRMTHDQMVKFVEEK